MGQVEDKDFTIKEDGTIVRDSSSPKINQMKKKLSSGNTVNNPNTEKGGKNFWGCLLFLIIGIIIGSIIIFNNKDSSYDSTVPYSSEESTVADDIAGDEVIFTEEEFTTKRYTRERGEQSSASSCKIQIDYPITGNSELVTAIRQWINKYLGSLSETNQYGGTLDDGNQIVDYYFSKNNNESCDDCHLSIHILKEYETENYITYLFGFYSYSSGAHGIGGEGGATFIKSDGKIIDWGMFTNDSDMQRLIKNGLNEYFGDEDYDKDYTPLPAENPILLGNGVKFIYGVYEIEGTSYASGQPQFTIPYSEIKYQMNSSLCDLIFDN